MKVLVATKSLSLLQRVLSVIDDIKVLRTMGYVSCEEQANGLINTMGFDVLIVEVLLADGSGFGVMAHAKKMLSRAKIIFISDASYEDYRNKSLELGADSFFNLEQDFDSFQRTLIKFAADFNDMAG